MSADSTPTNSPDDHAEQVRIYLSWVPPDHAKAAHAALDGLLEQFEAVEGALRGLLEMHCDCECSFHEDAYRVLEEVDKWRIFTRMNVT